MELLLFDNVDDKQPSRIIAFDQRRNRTFYYWHVFVPNLKSGQLYGYRAYGPLDLGYGYRYDGAKVLLDPYTKAVAVGKNYSREAAMRYGVDNCAHSLKSVVVDTTNYDWENDYSPHLQYNRSVIYELHVGGFTNNPNSGVSAAKRGTYAGLIEKIPYLQSLGINSVELMPVQHFDEQDAPAGLDNYWGYSPISFFAPHSGYSSRNDALGPVDEFRDMVKAFHRAGIEVILDVVFNHTAEGNENGPTLSFKGLENPAYYTLEKDRSKYTNYSGCGNTINANHSIVRRLIENCLCYWVMDMHVDGFRFDLASVMARGEQGELLSNPPVLWAIESNPILSGTKIIAEAWDAAGAYQVGSFIGDRFAEWNGPFRDDVRRFVKGDRGSVLPLAKRILASPDIYNYQHPKREIRRSINFVTCHDGFTMNDLVSYNEKHNESNRENNCDGNNNNISWNCGVEGPTNDPDTENLRIRQIKNFFTILLISQGTPMILMGDEVRRTQAGNNNVYCQNNTTGWFNWGDVEKNAELLRFVKGLLFFTQRHEIFRVVNCWMHPGEEQDSFVHWHGTNIGKPDIGSDSHSISFGLYHKKSGEYMHIILNAYWEPLEFQLSVPESGKQWHRIVDTSLNSPDDITAPETAKPVDEAIYKAEPRSSIILMAF